MMKRWITLCAISGALLLPGIAQAGQTAIKEEKIVATEVFEGLRVAFKPGAKYANATLIITGPADYQAEVFNKSTLPSINLEKYGKVVDGNFRYQLIASTGKKIEILNPGLNNGRDDIPGSKLAGAQLSGIFCVKNGKIVPFEDIPEGKGEK
ncbi:MAG: hypothetical protein AB3N20_03520 [Rhizobiaceae bacterium]